MATKKVDDLGVMEKQLNEAPELISKLESVLGVKGKTEIMALLKSDPEARRLAQKIMGAASPIGAETAMNPPAPDQKLADQMYGRRKSKIEF